MCLFVCAYSFLFLSRTFLRHTNTFLRLITIIPFILPRFRTNRSWKRAKERESEWEKCVLSPNPVFMILRNDRNTFYVPVFLFLVWLFHGMPWYVCCLYGGNHRALLGSLALCLSYSSFVCCITLVQMRMRQIKHYDRQREESRRR